ncbi:MAG: cupin domain-containing protein [Acidobacteria bacterium]|nr:cupin domain-containing protein [Acidobacteriota bacterium]
MPPVFPTPANHYAWGLGCEGWHLLQDPALHVIQERVPPGQSERRHRHGAAQQFFFILRGEAVLELDGAAHRLQAGEGLHVPPGRPHQFLNPTDAPVDFLVISSPTTRGDREDLD